MGSVHFDTGDTCNRTTGITIGTSDAFSLFGWFQFDNHGGGSFQQGLYLTGSAYIAFTTDETATNSIDVYVTNTSFSNFQVEQVAAPTHSTWIWIGITRAASSNNYLVYKRLPGDSSVTLVDTIAHGAAESFNALRVANNPFGDPTSVDICAVGLVIGTQLNATQLFDLSNNLAYDGSAHNTKLRLATAATAGTNSGTAGDYTVGGTPDDESSEPSLGGGGGPSTDQAPLSVPLFPSKISPLARRVVDFVAPIGTLLAAGGLSSIAWGTSVPLPQKPRPTRPLPPQAVAPIGAGTFALSKIAHATALPHPRTQPQIPRRPEPVAPVGTLLTPTDSLGWLQIDASPPRQRSMVVFAVAGEPTSTATALTSLGWLACDPPPNSALASLRRRPEPSQPTSPLAPFVSPSTGWLRTDSSAPILRYRRPEPSAPTGPLVPFVSLSTGWFPSETPPRAEVFGGRPQPSDPVGTAFAIALPSNGWLATDNPRTPLRLQRAVPTDPVGSPLAAQTLPTIGWLATDNPRTPYRTQRAVPVDPVGQRFALPGALGPYWFAEQQAPRPLRVLPPQPVDPPAALAAALSSLGWLDQPEARRPATSPRREQCVEPVGEAFSTLRSVGWFQVHEPARSPLAPARPQPFNPLRELQFGGSPWADLTSSPARVARSRTVEPSAPTGALASNDLPSFGWATTDTRAPKWRPPRVSPAEPVGTFYPPPPPSESVGWMQAMDLPAKHQRFSPMATEVAPVALYPVLHEALVGPIEGRWLTVSVRPMELYWPDFED